MIEGDADHAVDQLGCPISDEHVTRQDASCANGLAGETRKEHARPTHIMFAYEVNTVLGVILCRALEARRAIALICPYQNIKGTDPV